MSFLICLAALGFLMFVAYRGYSVILFAPVAAMGAVLLTDPAAVPPIFTGLFMERMVVFVKLYFPVFLLGAVFGKVIELSGFSRSIVTSVIGLIGRERAMVSIVAVCCLLTYGGVSLFVVVFAVYPFAAEMFRQSDIPKRLIPGTIALGAFTATMDSFPGTPQIQNIIPTTFFKTTTWAAPILGTFGGLFILAVGLLYLEWRRRAAQKAGEGYGTGHINEPEPIGSDKLPNPVIAMAPLLLVLVMNFIFTDLIKRFYPATVEVALIPGGSKVIQQTSSVAAIWAVEGALIIGIVFVVIFGWKAIASRFAAGSQQAVAGSLLASLNTASEYGFGAVIAALPGFIFIRDALTAIPNPLVNIAISVTVLAGITGSASGGMSIALAAMADQFVAMANAAHIPLEVLHRVASMASGGMDTLPHNGAVITLLNVTGLTHRQSYKDIFAITCIKTSSVFVVIGLYYLTGLV
ncbi:GntP family permease [Rhodoplanes sp. TEM]|uniref:GntP family permease n=1 Tax=Rhodoplanes tepidamans TaxID=200616 RepID=A0ABT5JBM1_RHOTP|nr:MULTISPECIES: GntP family permease [Rhodoplanes]MDC7787074.1 GntP family permease [Rhodoplanes tepidamans]MDC7986333.1 GntP family permease [Rhodoplanes sp. TEM]MDQ0358674.1 H+/gluconate symporter-like permease [Rhodoplanes tepidamans]